MPKAAIISKPQKLEMQSILPELIDWLAGHGFEVILDPESAAYLGRESQAILRAAMPALSPAIVVSLGGDGTLLSAARAFALTDTPILGVNLGSLGFLTEIPLPEMYAALEAWMAGTAIVDTRSLMHAQLFRDNRLFREWDALNDVVLAKGAIARMGEFAIELDGQFVARFRADGVIVSTPTGSTAYTLAANGYLPAPADHPAYRVPRRLGDHGGGRRRTARDVPHGGWPGGGGAAVERPHPLPQIQPLRPHAAAASERAIQCAKEQVELG
jgi:NAD+ kinase